MSLNLILLIGNAGRDAELRYTSSGRAVAGFSIAVNRNYQVDGEWREETEWFNVSSWGQQAENVANSVRRGSRVFVEGRLATREYTTQAGLSRTSLDVNAFRVINLSAREESGEGGYGTYPPAPESQQAQGGSYSPQGAQPAQSGHVPAGGFDQGPEGEDLEDLPW